MSPISLRTTTVEDLELFFSFQQDKEAQYLAAFVSKDYSDWNAYLAKWTGLLANPTITMRTVLLDGEVVGSVAKYMMHGQAEVTYWLDKRCWGRGVATGALSQFLLAVEPTRPIYAHVAFDNYGSQKVLEKCGFRKTGVERGFAEARGGEIEEFVYELL